jgi:hypothetical protein
MNKQDVNSNLPLVKDPTRSVSENIQTVVTKLQQNEVYIPDYQRDSEQWDQAKQSLFLESLLNNLTIPAFFFCEDANWTYEVVDGQQRLTTILKFVQNELTISDDDSISYLTPQAAQYRGKTFRELPTILQRIFNNYPLTIIYLPPNMELNIKLELFRRINEGGSPLTGHDIRLGYYSQSYCVTFIRLVGIYRDSESANRMIHSASQKEVSNPWDQHKEAKKTWFNWWQGKARAKGQTPSLMFLWYLVCLYRKELDDLLKLPSLSHLNMSFLGSTEDALDIFCAQLQYQDIEDKNDQSAILPSLSEIENKFNYFASWIKNILDEKLPGIGVDKDKQLAFFLAGCTELDLIDTQLSETQWQLTGKFIRSPRKAGEDILPNQEKYPEPKGRWTGPRGQKAQCEKAVEIVKIIKNQD